MTWRGSYYFHAGFGAIVFFVWLWLYRDDPKLHGFVNDKEVSTIHLNKTAAHIEYDSFVPYWVSPLPPLSPSSHFQEILKNPIILVVLFNAFIEITAILLLLQYAPQYFYYVLGYDKVTTGRPSPASDHFPFQVTSPPSLRSPSSLSKLSWVFLATNSSESPSLRVELAQLCQ